MLVDKKFFELLLEEFVNANTDEDGRWITIKPHGDDSEDYRRLKLRKGETPKEAIERVYKKEEKKEKKEDKGKDIYSKLITKDVEKTLRDSVKAQKYDNPKAKIGDTMLDSDRIISRFSSNLTSKEYDKFDWEKAEDILFEKLKEIEKEFGFKQEEKAHKEKVKEFDNIEIRTKDGIKKVSFADISLSDEYLKKNKKHSEVWDSKIQAMIKNPYYDKEKDIKKQLKKEKIEELAKNYKRNPNVTPLEEFIKRQKSLNPNKYDK